APAARPSLSCTGREVGGECPLRGARTALLVASPFLLLTAAIRYAVRSARRTMNVEGDEHVRPRYRRGRTGRCECCNLRWARRIADRRPGRRQGHDASGDALQPPGIPGWAHRPRAGGPGPGAGPEVRGRVGEGGRSLAGAP